MLPKQYTEVLKVLQDSGPSLPFEKVKIILDEFGDFKTTFKSFDTEAIAAASLA